MSLSDKRTERGFYFERDIKSTIKELIEENESLMKQLIIDFKIPLEEKSAKEYIEARFEMSNKRKDEIFGEELCK